jgi:hypothetical protein
MSFSPIREVISSASFGLASFGPPGGPAPSPLLGRSASAAADADPSPVAASPYEGDLGDAAFWRSTAAAAAAAGVVPRQRVFNAQAAASPPHTLRRPQPRLRPAFSAARLRADRLAQHTNCCGTLGPVHAAKVLAERLGDPVPGLTTVHSLEPGTQLLASLRIADAFGEERRRADDEEFEWRKRFWLSRVLEGRERSFARTQRAATRAAMRASGEAEFAEAPFVRSFFRSGSRGSGGDSRSPSASPSASAHSSPLPSPGAASESAASYFAMAAGGEGGAFGATAQLQAQHMQQQARKPVYVDRNVLWRRFGGSVNDLLVSQGRSAIPQLPPASPLGMGVGVTALGDARFPRAASPPAAVIEASAAAKVWTLDSTGTTPAAFVAQAAVPAALRPAARPAASAVFQLDGVYERRRSPHPDLRLQRGSVQSALLPGAAASLLAL